MTKLRIAALLAVLILPACAAEGPKAPGPKMVKQQEASPQGAVKTSSGLVYTSIQEGSGAKPTALDTVKVHYRGTLLDGTEFDSSYKRNAPAEFPLNRVIKCWTEGVQMMKVGGKAQLVCPPEIAYGSRGAGSAVPPNATLIFQVELLEVRK
jgi:FKBP-type peptidyl-prolyl cis-trans isomerase FkpA